MIATRVLTTIGSVLVLAAAAQGSTVGLWLFDAPAGIAKDANVADGTQFADESAGNNPFVFFDEVANSSSTFTGPQIHYSTDVPSVLAAAAPGSTALSSVLGIGRFIESLNSTDAYSLGKTGQLTVEFWHKSNATSSTHFQNLIGHRAPAGVPDVPGRFQISTGVENLGVPIPNQPGYEWNVDQCGATGCSSPDLVRLRTAQDWTSVDPPDVWKHVAVTMDLVSGEGKIYVNGVTQAILPNRISPFPASNGKSLNTDLTSISPAPKDARLVLLANAVGAQTNFGGWAALDELRISDVVLLPGEGTGVGELAWNASLVPEPATLGLLVIAGLTMLSRRR